MRAIVKVRQWGGTTVGITLPKEMLNATGIQVGDRVMLTATDMGTGPPYKTSVIVVTKEE